jgi:tetratricopeptide (TPR) repeat protein
MKAELSPSGNPERSRILDFFAALAIGASREAPPALVLEELLSLEPDLTPEQRAAFQAAKAQVFLACGGFELSRHQHPGIDLDLLWGEPEAVEQPNEEGEPRRKARILAARGDWKGLRTELETWSLSQVQEWEGLSDLALYGECLGRPEWSLDALQRLMESDDGGEEQEKFRYHLCLAQLRLGIRSEGEAGLEQLVQSGSWVGLASRELLASLRSGEAQDGKAPEEGSFCTPLGAWAGVPACAASVVRGLWQLGKRISPRDLAKRVRLEGADVLSALELLDFLRDQGVPATQIEADLGSLEHAGRAGEPVVLRFLLPGKGSSWGVLGGFDSALRLFRILLPQTGELLEISGPALESMQEPLGRAALVLEGGGHVGGVSLALETLDEAVRQARAGELGEALERLERGRAYCPRLMPLRMLEAELEVVGTLGGRRQGKDELLACLDQVEQEWPDQSWPLLFRARYFLEAGEREEGYQVLLRAVRRPRVEAEVWTELGDLQEERGQQEEAARSWWKAHHVNPLYPRPAEQLSRYYRRKKRFDVALSLCEVALESSPLNPYNWEMLGILLGEVGGEEERVEASLLHAIELNPQRPYAYGILCDTRVRKGDVKGAIKILEEAAARVEDAYPCFVRMAELRFDRQDYRGTIEAAEQALELRGGEAAPTALIGASYGRCGEVDRSVDLLKRSIELDPLDPWAVRELAIHLREAGRIEEALEALGNGVERLPNDVGIRAQLALTYEVEGEFQKGLNAAREALELAGPDALEVVRLVARLAFSGGGLLVAEAIWRAAVAASSDRAKASKQYVSFLLDYEAFEQAEREGQKALHLSPGDEELNAWYGYALVRMQRYKDAIPWLKRSLEKVPEYSFARSVLLDALTETGEDLQAIEIYRETQGALTPLGHECAFVAFVRLGSHAEALRVARKAALAVPGSAEFFHRRAARLLLDDLGEVEMALREAELAAEASPEDSRSQEILAWCLAANRRYEEAEQAMDRMLQAGAEEVPLLRFRRYLAGRRGDHRGEEACCRELARVHAEEERAHRHWMVEAAACLIWSNPDWAAFEDSLKGLRLTPLNWARLGRQAAQMGVAHLATPCLKAAGKGAGSDGVVARAFQAIWEKDFSASLKFFRTLGEAYPEDPRGEEYQALLLLLLDQPSEVASYLAQARQVRSFLSPLGHLVEGAVYLLGELPEKARESFLNAEKLAPDGEPSLIRVMALWARGELSQAAVAYQAVQGSRWTSPDEQRLGELLGEAVGLL